ncbi:MAG: hypothetical protein Q8Q63_04855 [Phaeovulum sp.]|uniref:hypothetical protein n=1 Tax=Phaeovulum sp. TaxID=2934796 RepID=UPI002735E6AA|nr:hypothetical protein [Phaeovulum sp.]MDP3860896.1 hypothetical protein [Phaeovulum sp.]
MKKTAFAITLASALMMSVAAFADTPPTEGTSCVSGCTLPNATWSFGDPEVTGTETNTFESSETDEQTINMANLKSGGKASAKNQSNFRAVVTTTTTIEYTVTTTESDHINNGGNVNNNPADGPKVEETVEIISEETETTVGDLEHVHPHE